MAAHASDPIPAVTAVRPELPKAVDGLLSKALAKDSAMRFQSAGELLTGLDVIADAASTGQTKLVVPPDEHTPANRARRWLRSNVPLAAVGSSLATIAVVVTIALASGGGGRPNEIVAPSSVTPSTSVTPSSSGTDAQPPTGGRIVVRAGDDSTEITSDLLVTIGIEEAPRDASGVARYLVANDPVRPSVADALPYTPTFQWRLADGPVGQRTVYVWFGDELGNFAATPVSASIVFDRPPTIISGLVYDRTGPANCEQYRAGEKVVLPMIPYIATDPDGDDTLRISQLWTGGEEFPGTKDLTTAIDVDGRGAKIGLTDLGDQQTRLTDYFTASDDQGLTGSGYFHIDVGGC